MNSKVWDYIVLAVVVIGAVNWGLIGFFKFDLVAWLFGSMSLLTRIIYAIIESFSMCLIRCGKKYLFYILQRYDDMRLYFIGQFGCICRNTQNKINSELCRNRFQRLNCFCDVGAFETRNL